MDLIFYSGLLAPVTICGITDLRKRVIKNQVVFITAVAGLIFHAFWGQGLVYSLAGALTGFITGYVGYRVGGVAAGDAKLLTALGVWLGVHDLYWVLFVGSVTGVIWGIVKLLKHKELVSTIKEAGNIRYGIAFLRKIPKDIDAPLPKDVIPFGTCLALATWLVVAIKPMGGFSW